MDLDRIHDLLSDAYFAARYNRRQEAITALNKVALEIRDYTKGSPELNTLYINMRTIGKRIWKYWPDSKDMDMDSISKNLRTVHAWCECKRDVA